MYGSRATNSRGEPPMAKRLEADVHDWDNWEPPPIDPETEERLRAAGVRAPTGRPDPNFKPLPQRPAWLAFIFRMLRVNP